MSAPIKALAIASDSVRTRASLGPKSCLRALTSTRPPAGPTVLGNATQQPTKCEPVVNDVRSNQKEQDRAQRLENPSGIS